MAERKWFDEIYGGIADAVRDIREKVVEEAWYGRVVNERECAAPEWPQARSEIEAAQNVEQEREQKAPEQDIDR